VSRVPTRLPVCVVGAGPAGLAMARALKRAGLPFQVFEKNPGVGGIWDPDHAGSPMYDSAHFISSRDAPMSTFRGHPFPRDAAIYPSHRQVLAYLQAFAADEGLLPHIRTGARVESATPDDTGWRVSVNGIERHYSAVVCASGTLWEPVIADLPGAATFSGRIRHSVTYRSPRELSGRRVLIVGAGNSAVDIASDAARSAAAVSLSMRRGYWFVPKFVGGEPSDTFFRRANALPGWASPPDAAALLKLLAGPPEAYGLPAPDHEPFASHPIMNSEVLSHLGHGRIKPRPAISHLTASAVVYSDGAVEEIDEIILATGYRAATPFLPGGLFEHGDGLRPELFMRLCHRSRRDLYGLGFIETNSSVFRLVDLGAELIALDLLQRSAEPPGRSLLDELIASDAEPDLTGGRRRIATARHVGYVDSSAYAAALTELIALASPRDRLIDDAAAAA